MASSPSPWEVVGVAGTISVWSSPASSSSTEGINAHHCIIVSIDSISIIIIIDHNDSIEVWRETGKKIANAFFILFGKEFDPHEISEFKNFDVVIKEICEKHKNN